MLILVVVVGYCGWLLWLIIGLIIVVGYCGCCIGDAIYRVSTVVVSYLGDLFIGWWRIFRGGGCGCV